VTKKLKVLSLFAGIGGFDLGLERTGGFETVAFCEIEDFPKSVLRKNWPHVPVFPDVRNLTKSDLDDAGISVDVICGGFPCQDISVAGRMAGISYETRSGLWSEIVRLIGELRPRYVIVENVANLLAGPSDRPGRWFGRVLGDLAERGYDAEWENIPAATLGAPHRRERVWIVAYPSKERSVPGVERILSFYAPRELGRSSRRDGVFGRDNPRVCDVDDGFPRGLGGHFAGGNAVVPQIPEMIGRAILEAERGA